jgi:hypothetical protein
LERNDVDVVVLLEIYSEGGIGVMKEHNVAA